MTMSAPKLLRDEAETEALVEAVAQARTDMRGVPHEDMRQWLLQAADGDISAPPPAARTQTF